jgi:hypothetical protein
MLFDLSGHGAVEREADFIVIGAGTDCLPVSILLAQRIGCL